MSTSKPRPKSDVTSFGADFHPYAECLQDGCFYRIDQRPDAKQVAKNHAYYHPGHKVRVVRESVTVYEMEPLSTTTEPTGQTA